MTIDDARAIAVQTRISGNGVPQIIERPGYLADETVFNFIRAGIADAAARCGMMAPIHVCHSLGCFVGLDAASRQPDAIVIAINMPVSPWHGFRRAAGVVARMTRLVSQQGASEANHFRDSLIYFGSHSIDDLTRQRLKRIRQRTRGYSAPRRQDTALFLKTVMLEHRPKGPHLPRVLLVQGDRDPIAPVRHVNLLRDRLPNATLMAIDGAHVLPVTHPQDVVRAVESFLQAI